MKTNILLILLVFASAVSSLAQLTSTDGTIGTGNGTTTPDMALKTGSAASGTTRVTIASSGNVGIGTTSPANKLDVNGSFRATSVNTSGGTIVSSNPANNMSFTVNNATRMTILTSGNVGIGTASPSTALDVNGTITATALTVNGVAYIPSQWTVSSTTIYNNNTGNVGIGTSSPSEKLHVSGNILSSQVTTTSGIYSSSSGTGLSFKTGTTERITVSNSNGYTGIGTNTPSEMLQVNGNVLSSQFSASTGNFNSTGNLSLLTAGTSRLSILNTNGNVGIGTASPESKLHVTGNVILENGSSPTLYTGTGSSDLNRYLLLSNSTANTASSGLKAGGVLIADSYSYANPSKNDLVVKGTVAVGTPLSSNPNGYTLAVNGKIGAKDVQVERSSWPDYVFATDYKLPSLASVEKYIEENNHLEGVPSAEEVKKDGHLLGEMDEILLKKIEELTLYVIEQQKEIDALKKSLETQKKKRR